MSFLDNEMVFRAALERRAEEDRLGVASVEEIGLVSDGFAVHFPAIGSAALEGQVDPDGPLFL